MRFQKRSFYFFSRTHPFGLASNARAAVLTLGLLGVHLTGCAAYYIGGKTKEIPVAQYRKPQSPKPVQMLFEFRRNGVQDTDGTRFLWDAAVVQVENSGLFSEINNRPVPGGALITIVLDARSYDGEKSGSSNTSPAPPDVDAIAGDFLKDIFCKAKFYSATASRAVEKESRQQIYYDFSGSSVPAGSIRIGWSAPSQDKAYKSMLRQVISHVLNDLSNDPSFYSGEGK